MLRARARGRVILAASALGPLSRPIPPRSPRPRCPPDHPQISTRSPTCSPGPARSPAPASRGPWPPGSARQSRAGPAFGCFRLVGGWLAVERGQRQRLLCWSVEEDSCCFYFDSEVQATCMSAPPTAQTNLRDVGQQRPRVIELLAHHQRLELDQRQQQRVRDDGELPGGGFLVSEVLEVLEVLEGGFVMASVGKLRGGLSGCVGWMVDWFAHLSIKYTRLWAAR